MDVRSLYTNVPQEEGIEKVCKAYDALISIKKKPPSPQNISKERWNILQETSFQFNGKNYLQTHGTAIGTEMAVAFANIFMGTLES